MFAMTPLFAAVKSLIPGARYNPMRTSGATCAHRNRKSRHRNIAVWLLLSVLFIGVMTAAETAQAYTISGQVTNTTSTAGWVYLSLNNQGGGSFNGLGTSVWVAAAGNPGSSVSFNIGGMPSVPSSTNLVINGFLDIVGSGIQYANSPDGSSGSIPFDNNNPSGITFNIGWPSPPLSLSSPISAPQILTTVTTSGGGAAVVFDSSQMPQQNGLSVVESVDIYWGYDNTPLSDGNFYNVPVGNNDVLFLNNLNSTGTLYVQMVPKVAGIEDQVHASGVVSAPIAAPTAGSTVNGTVFSTGIAKSTSTPLYIALVPADKGPGQPFITYVNNPQDTQAYTMTGISAGTYQIFTMLDMNNDHIQDVGDITDTNGNGKNGPSITVDGSSTYAAPIVSLIAVNNAVATVGTGHNRSAGSNNGDSYSLMVNINSGAKMPVSAAVTAGPQIASLVPIDLVWNSNSNSIQLSQQLPARPSVGDSYSVTINYSDNKVDNISLPVTAVLDNFPMPIYPTGSTAPDSTNPLLSWRSPGPNGAYSYNIQVQDSSYNTVWNRNNSLLADQLWVSYNDDGSASPLVTGTTYNSSVTANDPYGNQAQYQASFTPQSSGPTITGFGPTYGPFETPVTINGTGFISGSTFVQFGGVTATTFAVNSSTQIVANVPSGAPVGPITVNVSGTSTSSSASFEPTITYTGTVSNNSSQLLNSVNVSTVGLYPTYPEVSTQTYTDSTYGQGYYSITVPSGLPFSIHMSLSSYLDLYTAFSQSTQNNSGSAYTLHNTADLLSNGITLEAGKGLIRTKVKEADNSNTLAGVTITTTSMYHGVNYYPVTYTGGGSSTVADGVFNVLNVDEGDYVTVTASESGWGFLPRIYITHANAVNEQAVKGTTLPVVTANPLSGTYTSAQNVVLTAGDSIACASVCTIHYTTDGSDPTLPGAFSSPSPTGSISIPSSETLNFYAQNGDGIKGNVSSANYLINIPPIDGSCGSSNGQTFTTAPTSNLCSAGTTSTVNGSGPWSWTCNGQNGGTDASCSANITTYLLTVNTSGDGWAAITSTTGVIDYNYPETNTASEELNYGGSDMLTATAGSGYAVTWSGCPSTGGTTSAATCMISSMTSAMAVTADVSLASCINMPVRIMNTMSYYESIQAACSAAGSGYTVQMQAGDFGEDLMLVNAWPAKLSGGYSCDYSTNSGFTNIHGTVILAGSAMTVDKIVITSATSTPPTTVPSAPTGPTATAGDSQVTIAWNLVPGATSYNIYWSLTTPVAMAYGNRIPVATAPQTLSGLTGTGNANKITGVTNPYTVTGLNNGTPYYFIVTAVNNSGESPASSTMTATPGSAPTVSIVPTYLDIDLPFNYAQTLTIGNTGPGSSTLNYRVADDGALGGFLNVQNATGALVGGQYSNVNVSVLSQFASDASLYGSTIVLDVYTPGATNYTKFPVAVNLINPEITIQSSNCTVSGPDDSGNYNVVFGFSGTVQAATYDQMWTGTDSPATFTCLGWSSNCTRMPGDPVTTQWTYQQTYSASSPPTSATEGFMLSYGSHGSNGIMVGVGGDVQCQTIY